MSIKNKRGRATVWYCTSCPAFFVGRHPSKAKRAGWDVRRGQVRCKVCVVAAKGAVR